MPDELLFTVDGTTAVPAQPITLAEAGLLERKHLQQWVIDHPQLIGDGIKVVTFEYGRWVSAAGSTADRLDVLGLDRTGRLVVIELKRDQAPDTITMQAINYAAMWHPGHLPRSRGTQGLRRAAPHRPPGDRRRDPADDRGPRPSRSRPGGDPGVA
jgi:hypothetical protein